MASKSRRYFTLNILLAGAGAVMGGFWSIVVGAGGFDQCRVWPAQRDGLGGFA